MSRSVSRGLTYSLTLLLSAALLGACSSEPPNRLIGTWDARLNGVEGSRPGVEDLSFSVAFKAGGHMTWLVRSPKGTQETTGRWKILQEQGGRLTIETSKPEGIGRTRSQELTVTFDGDDYCDLSKADSSLLMSLSRI